ncbi:nucleolar protein 16-like [Uloborus diversus]|uniref:nucleolar protein 16-like n=1 Tax=Uloborus diversus TaxID=327109 RepID=UPI002409DDB4|nr:nucleolar protein 16-like [Uloborus diversus]
MLALPKIKCDQLKSSWDASKSYLRNMSEMGLADDPNRAVHKKKPKKAMKMEVISALEAEANAPQERMLRLPTEPIKFCVYMIEKYAEDYEAMSRDPKNYYQLTPSQIRKKINKFKSILPQWNGYLRAKGLLEGVPTDASEYQIDIPQIMHGEAAMET